VVPEKRKLMVVGAAITAAFALPGCAPAGLNSADYGNAAEPASNVAASPGATEGASPDPSSTADPTSTSAAAANDGSEVPTLTDAQVTHSLTGTKVARMGEVIENDKGFVFYRFDGDSNNPAKSACSGDCAKVWKPALSIDGKPTLKNVESKVVGTVTRADGTKQLTVKGWPIYTYAGDVKAGTWKGQNVSGKWFVIKPDGAKNLTCLPAISKPVAPPASSNDSGASDDSSSGGDYSY
jgi:predicted lipoprotein with Yx(FWY)xxD motif